LNGSKPGSRPGRVHAGELGDWGGGYTVETTDFGELRIYDDDDKEQCFLGFWFLLFGISWGCAVLWLFGYFFIGQI